MEAFDVEKRLETR